MPATPERHPGAEEHAADLPTRSRRPGNAPAEVVPEAGDGDTRRTGADMPERAAARGFALHDDRLRDELARALVARLDPHLVAEALCPTVAELRALERVGSDRDLLLVAFGVGRVLAERDEARDETD